MLPDKFFSRLANTLNDRYDSAAENSMAVSILIAAAIICDAIDDVLYDLPAEDDDADR
jgi:hypothetical protein